MGSVFISEVFSSCKVKNFSLHWLFNILERAAKYVFEQQFWLLHLLLSDCWSYFLYGVFYVNLCLSVTNLDTQVEGGEWKRKTGYKVYRSTLLAQKHEWTSIFLLLTLWARPSVNCRPSSKTVYPDRKYLTPLLICIRCWDMFQFVVLAFATSLSENVILEALSKCVVGFPAEVQIPLFKNF